jgi:multicomponent K+:H+ antiporter subunit D
MTAAIGAIGVLGSREIGRLVAFGAIASVGTLLTAISLFTPESAAAAIYYIVHSTLTAAALFLIADMVMERQSGDIAPQPVMAQSGLISALFFVAAIAMAGMPPLSGFLGKLLVLDAARDHALAPWVWAVILVSSLVTLLGLARAGTAIFWKSHGLQTRVGHLAATPQSAPSTALTFVAVIGLLILVAVYTVASGPVMRYAEATAADLFDRNTYLKTVMANRDRPVGKDNKDSSPKQDKQSEETH